MLSRLRALSPLANTIKLKLVGNNQLNQNIIYKRWSGHNNMNIEPSNFPMKKAKDMMHFYVLLTSIPIIVITTIINIRANPELTEIPEGYEPRHWEYYKHPITRFLAKYVYMPMETEWEVYLGNHEMISESQIMNQIERKVNHVMAFYNDHRSQYFKPYFAEFFRISRDDNLYGHSYMLTSEGHHLDNAYDSTTSPISPAGYRPPDSS